MLETLFSRLAPHYCLSCGEIGRQICESCFYDIELSPRQTCLRCHAFLVNQTCRDCAELAGVIQLVLAPREGVLGKLLDAYKFDCTRESYKILGRLYDEGLPYFDGNTVLVPLPTSPTHVRKRSFDHTHDIVRELGMRRDLRVKSVLRRSHNKAQFGSSYQERQIHAQGAFEVSKGVVLDDETQYVICDDIVTTGASMIAAVSRLREAGAKRVVAVALLQQPWK